ncbi:NUDIX hydrolase [Compostimonas suwonensis]|uniref:8-oxo-dGTP diphosphatase n=1 Tax=Compostimonas suwonensis TaxID=1048394 RepID=A0A2M9BVK2_9MICO|nr:NUDIX domain-containing protein [Compostimonas suwonensis]PJJ61934.1 8-oxo-dGTP diphosphatase [Compostimonas suwonensis]
MTEAAVYAAGAVCWRIVDDKPHVLVIHRTQHKDVSLPKGKVDPGETLPQTAVREILEETGLRVALGVPLGISRYPLMSGREKIVHYWAAEITEDAVNASTFLPNDEVAGLEWLTIKKARAALSYERDVEILDTFQALVKQGVLGTYAIIALRHAKAVPPFEWEGDDASRPLSRRGEQQAASLVDTISAWRPRRIVSSTAQRCQSTVEPLSRAVGRKVVTTAAISQDAYENGQADVREVVGRRVRSRKTSVLCSHGPVLPEIIREISLATGTPAGSYVNNASTLDTAAFAVVHLSRTSPASGIIAIETHSPRL